MTPQTKKTFIRLGAGIAFFVVLIWFMQAMEEVTTIIMVAFFLAYILNPAVNKLDSWGLARPVASMIILLFGILFIVGLFLIFVPAVAQEMASFAKRGPSYLASLKNQIWTLAEKLNVQLPQDWDQISGILIEKGRQIIPKLADPVAKIFSSLFKSTVHIISAVFYILLVPVITYYFLVSFEKIKEAIYDLIPPYTREPITERLRQIDSVLAGFIRGQLTICLILAVLYSLGFLVIGIDLAVVLGTLSGILFIIPYLGTIFGIVSGSLMALAKYGDLMHVVYILGWIGLVQLLEGYVLTPRIVGHRIGLHPAVYILALVAAGNLFGFVGLLVAIPAAAILKVLLTTAVEMYKQSYLYNDPAKKQINL